MKNENQQHRRRQIEAAAYEILAEKGYKATSMLAVAKRASASNETLYKWYGSKQALFEALVHENARIVKQSLIESADADPIDTMRLVGPRLLQLVTSERAVALNRAAVGDYHETGALGKTIATGGREAVVPLIGAMFENARQQGLMLFDQAGEVAAIYVNLLIGDLQIQRAIGARNELKLKEIRARAERADELIVQLFGTQKLRQRMRQE